jgi:RNA polymerase sigma-70 factor, ECF subfamily
MSEPVSAAATTGATAAIAIESAYRSDWGRLVAQLVATTRRLDLAEEAMAEALARASQRWPVDGVPVNPAGWLYTAAHRWVIGRLRAEAVAARKLPLLTIDRAWSTDAAADDSTPERAGSSHVGDERLSLLMLSCHPALDPLAQAALSLRLVIGTSTEQIARLFLVSTPTMAARLTRAKRKIAVAGIALTRSPLDGWQERLEGVCRTIYLAFTAGYTPGPGRDLVRAEVAGDAVSLALALRELVAQQRASAARTHASSGGPPDTSAQLVDALCALLMLQHARRDARQRDGWLVTLDEQDRSVWKHDEITDGARLLAGLPSTHGFAEELRLQAAIAAEHSCATIAGATDWRQVVTHYEQLELLTGSAIVRMNRAVAVAEVEGPAAALLLLDGVDTRLAAGDHRPHLVRAELHSRLGQLDAALASMTGALRLCANEVEAAHIRRRLGELTVRM